MEEWSGVEKWSEVCDWSWIPGSAPSTHCTCSHKAHTPPHCTGAALRPTPCCASRFDLPPPQTSAEYDTFGSTAAELARRAATDAATERPSGG